MIVFYAAAVFLTLALVLLLRPLAMRINLVAEPGEHRRHQRSTPLVGGMAIYTTLMTLGTFTISAIPVPVAAAATLVVFFGLLDDRWTIPFWVRFVIQIAAAFILVRYQGITLDHLGFLVSEERYDLGSWSTALTVFSIVGVINAVNMVDGMDGLAGSLVVICLFAVAISVGGYAETLMSVCVLIISSIIGFLIMNFRTVGRSQASIFMGDAGSTLLVLLVAWILIDVSQRPQTPVPPVLALWFLAIPLFDTVGVMVRRIFRGQTPFRADFLHTHHLLQAAGCSVNQALLLILGMAIGFACFGAAAYRWGVQESTLFYLFLLLFGLYLLIMEIGCRYVRR